MKQISEQEWEKIQAERAELSRLTAPRPPKNAPPRLVELIEKWHAQGEHLLIMELHEAFKLLLIERGITGERTQR
jgi:hypothetical protein